MMSAEAKLEEFFHLLVTTAAYIFLSSVAILAVEQ